MKTAWRRPVLAAALSLVTVAGSLLLAGPAQAQTVDSGTLSFSGDPGDWVSGGQSYSYATANGDQMLVSSFANNVVNITVNGANGDWWYLDFQAPSGQTLTSGTTYLNATRYPFNDGGAGLSLVGNGRGCNTVTGSFTVTNAVFGINGYVQNFDATFEQHCEGFPEAARGEVHITNPPQPPPPPTLDLKVVVATDGTASTLNGDGTVHGTVTCNKPTTVYLYGNIVEVVKRELIRGSFSTQVNCVPGTVFPWTGTASPNGTTPFQKGDAEVKLQAQAYDVDYNTYVTINSTSAVKLAKLR
jgi:hypothetical protein